MWQTPQLTLTKNQVRSVEAQAPSSAVLSSPKPWRMKSRADFEGLSSASGPWSGAAGIYVVTCEPMFQKDIVKIGSSGNLASRFADYLRDWNMWDVTLFAVVTMPDARTARLAENKIHSTMRQTGAMWAGKFRTDATTEYQSGIQPTGRRSGPCSRAQLSDGSRLGRDS